MRNSCIVKLNYKNFTYQISALNYKNVTIMNVNKVCYLLMQNQFEIQPQWNKKFLKFIFGDISGIYEME